MRAAGDGDQRFGAVFGERAQARAQPGGENHRLHLLGSPDLPDLFQLCVPDDDFNSRGAAQMLGQLLGEIDRAVLAAGAAEGDHQIRKPRR